MSKSNWTKIPLHFRSLLNSMVASTGLIDRRLECQAEEGGLSEATARRRLLVRAWCAGLEFFADGSCLFLSPTAWQPILLLHSVRKSRQKNQLTRIAISGFADRKNGLACVR